MNVAEFQAALDAIDEGWEIVHENHTENYFSVKSEDYSRNNSFSGTAEKVLAAVEARYNASIEPNDDEDDDLYEDDNQEEDEDIFGDDDDDDDDEDDD